MVDRPRDFDDTTINIEKAVERKELEGLDLYIKILDGPDIGEEIPLPFNKTTIGRKQTDVTLSDPLISRKHIEIEVLGRGYYFVKDLASSNGTLVNGVNVTTQRIKPYDEIKIGNTILTIIEK